MNIVWKRPDGGISITHLTPDAMEAGIDLLEHAQELKDRGNIPPDFELVATDIDLPPNREWRAAWAWTTPESVIDICPVKAAELTKQRLRKERIPLLAALDVAFMRALESGEDTKPIVMEKQRLRDITSLADAINPGDFPALASLTCAAQP